MLHSQCDVIIEWATVGFYRKSELVVVHMLLLNLKYLRGELKHSQSINCF